MVSNHGRQPLTERGKAIDDYNRMMSIPHGNCGITCASLITANKMIQDQQFMQFLVGLNVDYKPLCLRHAFTPMYNHLRKSNKKGGNLQTMNKGWEGCKASNRVEGRANYGARMHNRRDAPSFVGANQTLFTSEATRTDLECVSVDAHQLHGASS
ncbi:hypothetical protein Cgig2_003527 [Carnegiea gigantea]|uniref:Uncharacterized protein n=1 Tax=Carnegiea gigantea TaxID=171969 RepID=A0A9Q1GM79_9CARY|nr:hypothetical protein Cgig2_003527 [Carnegiea gigantea]